MRHEIDNKHLDYFKKLIEGNGVPSFQIYFKKNQDALREQLPRAQFLRLKFNSIDEIQRILLAAGIQYQPNIIAVKTENYLMNFHPDVLDENGKIKPSHRHTILNGAVKHFGTDNQAAERALREFIGHPDNYNTEKSIARMEDVESLAELELKYGSEELGVFLLRNLATIKRQFSETDHVVIRAREILARHTQSQENS
ncbi:hypothetical protein RMR16_024690 (plasmid) [Agrobacterium sp. rho-13.3]|uniref:hypothetical protein n=1 Tax=Agrobacterium sp. rho-13.3 TaxID=3072980 RepID=UPI002A0BF071|nr:hypothetical protein [Agrobacterium sp. rho-13.3]MDX8310150.1 hypothetical protein [Agrobacterium sp. rho-13.3]